MANIPEETKKEIWKKVYLIIDEKNKTCKFGILFPSEEKIWVPSNEKDYNLDCKKTRHTGSGLEYVEIANDIFAIPYYYINRYYPLVFNEIMTSRYYHKEKKVKYSENHNALADFCDKVKEFKEAKYPNNDFSLETVELDEFRNDEIYLSKLLEKELNKEQTM